MADNVDFLLHRLKTARIDRDLSRVEAEVWRRIDTKRGEIFDGRAECAGFRHADTAATPERARDRPARLEADERSIQRDSSHRRQILRSPYRAPAGCRHRQPGACGCSDGGHGLWPRSPAGKHARRTRAGRTAACDHHVRAGHSRCADARAANDLRPQGARCPDRICLRQAVRDEPTDGVLAIAARGGDQAAFAVLMRRHKAWLYQFIRRYIADRDDAYDVLQESFVSTWGALARYDPARPFEAWLRRIALNKCRDRARRNTVRRTALRMFG